MQERPTLNRQLDSTTPPAIITENSLIEPNFICTENHSSFFKEHIGMRVSFNVQFQKWLKTNTGKTYKDAITAYYEILEEKKNKKNIYENIAKKKL